ncbi:Aft1 HRA domain-containing protein [Bisporella sp. PMI_857]|nr:Aft1 HRA domain-containing protein [Bisporella sp. PMI_857]
MGRSPTHTNKNGDSNKSPVQPKIELTQADSSNPKKDDTVNPESATKTEPLAPPPRPEPAVGSTPDYFSATHSNPAPALGSEPNPFEYSFANGNGEVQTPGGTKLPSVAALTSPAGVLGSITPGFWGSLRSGPLSPAMLSGPQKDDYFSDSHHLRGGFPTPNESGMRSGLTPGGGGSMFPEPSPGSAALFSQLGSGGATPSTIEFHRTALTAANSLKRESLQGQPNVTSQPQEANHSMEVKQPASSQFDQHDPQEAANSLFMLANNRNNPQPTSHYAVAPQVPVHGHPQPTMNIGNHSQQVSPTMANRTNGSISTTSGRGASEMSNSDNEQQSRPNTRGKGKRNNSQINQTNGRGKVDTSAKVPANKKAKGSNGHAMPEPEDEEQEELDMSKDEYNAKGQKMTDEEKRKNFLERNRVAALKCRQRKKQWLQNLQNKVEAYSSENEHLNIQLNQMKEEIVNLKTLLLSHKDCPLAQQQGLHNIMHQQVLDPFNGQINPYGMAAMSQQQVVGQNMQQRRFS